MKKVIVLVGPTASGKTKNSIEIAKAINAEIINGDSVQVYKELNIGSAKIKDDEMENIKHHLFDVVELGEEYSAFNFQKDVRKLIDEIETPLIVGGTGFYIKSALYNYEFNKETSNDNTYENYSNLELYEQLIKLDPKIEIDKNNKRRLIRAIEQAKSGKPRSEKNEKDKPLYDIFTIYLDIDRKLLEERLNQRLEIQFMEGFIEEVSNIKNQGYKLNIIGYRELDKYLDNIYTIEETKNEIIKTSKRLAKKQKTWFKHQMDAKFYNPLQENVTEDIIKDVKIFLKKE